jgi:hypothetical protein
LFAQSGCVILAGDPACFQGWVKTLANARFDDGYFEAALISFITVTLIVWFVNVSALQDWIQIAFKLPLAADLGRFFGFMHSHVVILNEFLDSSPSLLLRTLPMVPVHSFI